MKKRLLKNTHQGKELMEQFVSLLMSNLHTLSKDTNAVFYAQRIYAQFEQELKNYNGETNFLCKKISSQIKDFSNDYELFEKS